MKIKLLIMKLNQLSYVTMLIFGLVFLLYSCEKDEIIFEQDLISKSEMNIKGQGTIKLADSNFEKLLIDEGYDTNGETGDILKSDADKILELEIKRDHEIEDFSEIRHFVNLESLICFNNVFVELDVSKNLKLTTLHCYNNQITTLDVSKNLMLTDLKCYNNHLTSLDISKNPNLEELDCHNNSLTSLDVSKNPMLTN